MVCCFAQVTEREFLEHLHELNQKINFVKEQSFKESRSVQDIQGVLEKLKFKVRLRVRSVIAIDLYSSLWARWDNYGEKLHQSKTRLGWFSVMWVMLNHPHLVFIHYESMLQCNSELPTSNVCFYVIRREHNFHVFQRRTELNMARSNDCHMTIHVTILLLSSDLLQIHSNPLLPWCAEDSNEKHFLRSETTLNHSVFFDCVNSELHLSMET